MLKFIRKIIDSCKIDPSKISRRNKSFIHSSDGQVAVVLILVIAIALIFYAVTTNIGSFSEVKTVTTKGSNIGTSLLASQMASYGQAISQSQLGGKQKICSGSGALLAFALLVATVIIAIISCIIGCVGWALVFIVIGVMLSAAAFAIQVAIIEPGLTAMWNKVLGRALGFENRFSEQGLQVALRESVTDNASVPDLFDDDGDGVFGFDLATEEPLDEIGRFGFYYNKRLLEAGLPDTTFLVDFIAGLEDFLYLDPTGTDPTDTWALYDPIPACPDPLHPCCNAPIPSECNPCCLPVSIPNPQLLGGFPDPAPVRPECCDDPDPALFCGTATTCGALSPYGAAHPWVYKKHFENQENNPGVLSFKEKLGFDDEHQDYSKERPPLDPNGLQFPTLIPGWQQADATGHFVPPVFTPGTDIKPGIFSNLYKLKYFGMDLTAMGPASGNLALDPNHACHWYDSTYEPLCPPPGPQIPTEQFARQLILSTPPSATNPNHWVESILDNIPGSPALAPDKIALPPGIIAQDTDCAQEAWLSSTAPGLFLDGVGFWKDGGDQYCSTTWPYEEECTKNGPMGCTEPGQGGPAIPVDCRCTDVPGSADQFPDDPLDDIVYGLPIFFEEAQQFIALATQKLSSFASNFSIWYPDVARYIEPGTDPAPVGSSATPGVDCFAPCEPEDGALVQMMKTMEMMRDRLINLKFNDTDADGIGDGYEGLSCDEVWCVPPLVGGAECPGISPAEALTFDIQPVGVPGNGVRGDIEDIIACLDYTINNGGGTGFQACRATCNDLNCSNLPRSLLPLADFDPAAWTPPGNPAWQGDIDLILPCVDGCSDANCQAMPLFQVGGSCRQYFSTPPVFFDETVDCSGSSYFGVLDPAVDFLEAGNCYNPLIEYWGGLDPAVDFNAAVDCGGTQYFSTDPASPTQNWNPLDVTGNCYGVDYFPPAVIPISSNFDETIDCTGSLANDVNGWLTMINNALLFTSNPADTLSLLTCRNSCNDGACHNMPIKQNWGPGIPWYDDITNVLNPLTLPVAAPADAPSLQSCQSSCNAINCSTMPQFSSWGPGVPWYDLIVAAMPTAPLDDQARMAACQFTCSDIDCQAMPRYRSIWGPGNFWYDSIQVALNPLVPPVASPADAVLLSACLNGCNDLNCQSMPGGASWGPGNAWYDEISAALLLSPAIPGPDASALGACQTTCNDINCQAMPQYETGACGVQFFSLPPALFDETVECPTWGQGNVWYDEAIAALIISNPSCDLTDIDIDPTTTNDNGWLLNAGLSGPSAQSQKEKFEHRKLFLEDRLVEIDQMIALFDEGATEFATFLNCAATNPTGLDGPGCTLIKNRINPPPPPSGREGLPNHAIYAWQGHPRPNTAPGVNERPWRIVKVQVKTPGRCDNRCGPGGGPDPGWPDVKTYQKGFMGFTRCFELINIDGMVKSRVARFDETKQTVANTIEFPNRKPIWSFRFYAPDRTIPGIAANLGSLCDSSMVQDPNIGNALPARHVDIYKGAFMLTNRYDPSLDAPGTVDNRQCWDHVHRLLAQGVISETCAQYGWFTDGPGEGMSFMFVDCPSSGF